MNQNATSIPTVSESINVQRGALQSSKAVSHRRSCARPVVTESTRAKTTANSDVLEITIQSKAILASEWRLESPPCQVTIGTNGHFVGFRADLTTQLDEFTLESRQNRRQTSVYWPVERLFGTWGKMPQICSTKCRGRLKPGRFLNVRLVREKTS